MMGEKVEGKGGEGKGEVMSTIYSIYSVYDAYNHKQCIPVIGIVYTNL